MESCKYLIVGGGPAADAAVGGIREIDKSGSILIVSEEDDPPYGRPALSKELWKGVAVDTIWRRTHEAGAELRLGTMVVAIDRARRTATDSRGTEIRYEKLLLATGGSPRRLRNSDPGVIYFRRLGDFNRAWDSAHRGAEFAVIGGGFIGSELAAALAQNGSKVSLIFSAACMGDRVYPRPLANFLNVHYRKHGVDVRFDERVKRVERERNKLIVRTNSDARGLAVDVVVAGLGIKPNAGLAKAAGLRVGNGIVVDELLRSSDPHIFAAGDVANFPCLALDRRLRIEHEDNADAMGRTAGRNMAGGSQPYRHLPCFRSELFDLGYEAVGEVDSRLEIVQDWEEKFHKGVIYYLRSGRVRGVLLWNSRGSIDAARDLIASPRDQKLPPVGRLRGHG